MNGKKKEKREEKSLNIEKRRTDGERMPFMDSLGKKTKMDGRKPVANH